MVEIAIKMVDRTIILMVVVKVRSAVRTILNSLNVPFE